MLVYYQPEVYRYFPEKIVQSLLHDLPISVYYTSVEM